MSEDSKIDYSDLPEFNDWLDNDSENSVTISGFSFSPSDTLYNMNYDQYVEAYEAYLADDEIFINEVYANFPTPIAFYLWQAENNYDNPHHRLDLLKSTWEAVVFFLYGLIIGEARHRGLPFKNIGNKLDDYYSDHLAARLTIIENVMDYCQKNGFHLSCLNLFSIDVISKLKYLNQHRNSFAHSFAATPAEQKALYDELFPEMRNALKLLRPLTEVRIFRYHSNSDGGPLLPRCDVFQGHSLDGGKKVLRVTKDDFEKVLAYFNSQSVFALIEDDTMFCLAPFIHYKMDDQDIHPRIILYKKKLAGGKYLFSVIGQSAQVEVDKSIFQDRTAEIRKLILDGAI